MTLLRNKWVSQRALQSDTSVPCTSGCCVPWLKIEEQSPWDKAFIICLVEKDVFPVPTLQLSYVFAACN